MNIKLELLKGAVFDLLCNKLEDLEIEVDKIPDTTVIEVLSQIQKIISNRDKTDFEIVEEIICVFEKYRVDFSV